MLYPVAAGLGTGLSLIVAIGAQNAYVLRQGLRNDRVALVVAICTLSDLILIAAGVAGIGAVLTHAPWVLPTVRWCGVGFLLWYAASSVRRAFGSESLAPSAGDRRESARLIAGRALALTWLNPHVYLDTVLLLGTIAATHRDDAAAGQWWFALGAGLASTLWFCSLGFGARLLGPLLARPRAWRVLELVIAATMVLVAINLARG